MGSSRQGSSEVILGGACVVPACIDDQETFSAATSGGIPTLLLPRVTAVEISTILSLCTADLGGFPGFATVEVRS